MKQVVVIAGGFHPFHQGHYSLYQQALDKYPNADIYFAASDKTTERPFPFKVKQKLAQLYGITKEQFMQVNLPYKPVEITSKYDPDSTVLIYIRSNKDKNETPNPYTKKDGSPGYIQHVTKNMQPLSKHAYMDYFPTIEFGPSIKSASEIRYKWPTLSDKHKQVMVFSLYPQIKNNVKLVNQIVKIFDAILPSAQDYLPE